MFSQWQKHKQKRHRNRVQWRLKQTLTHKNQFYNSTIDIALFTYLVAISMPLIIS